MERTELFVKNKGKPKEGTSQDEAQKELNKIFNVASYADAKKQYKKLSLLIHPDKTAHLGKEAQKYLSTLYTFINDYYSLAN